MYEIAGETKKKQKNDMMQRGIVKKKNNGRLRDNLSFK